MPLAVEKSDGAAYSCSQSDSDGRSQFDPDGRALARPNGMFEQLRGRYTPVGHLVQMAHVHDVRPMYSNVTSDTGTDNECTNSGTLPDPDPEPNKHLRELVRWCEPAVDHQV